MKHLFSPCTRLHDLIESQGGLEEQESPIPEHLQELNLDVSTEEFLSAERAFTYADLFAIIGNEDTLAWLTPHTAVVDTRGKAVQAWNMLAGDMCCFTFIADGKEIVAMALSSEHLLEICDVVLRLLAVSVVHSVHLNGPSSPGLFINAPTLAYLMEKCQRLTF
jgi:hypothetical protein